MRINKQTYVRTYLSKDGASYINDLIAFVFRNQPYNYVHNYCMCVLLHVNIITIAILKVYRDMILLLFLYAYCFLITIMLKLTVSGRALLFIQRTCHIMLCTFYFAYFCLTTLLEYMSALLEYINILCKVYLMCWIYSSMIARHYN